MAAAEPDRPATRVPLPTGARKLLSLSGVVPLGVFLLLHVWITASIVGSPTVYDRQIGFLHGGPLLGFLEVVLVLVPLAFHGIYGVIRSLQPREPVHAYDSDLMRVLQRVSGVVVLVFVIAHVWEFRVQSWTNGLAPSSYSTKLIEHLSSTQWGGIPWIAFGYLVGIAASFFHLANGMTSFLTTWGIARTEASQRRARLLSRGAGMIFFALCAAMVLQLATGARFFPAEAPRLVLATTCGSAPTPSAPIKPLASSAPSASAAPSPSVRPTP